MVHASRQTDGLPVISSEQFCVNFFACSCQFVVQLGGDYAVNCVDPDLIVDWGLIEQVVRLL